MALPSLPLVLLHLLLLIPAVTPQNISTSTPIPPLQWINLSNLVQGSSPPPPLKDAAIGYDETSRSLIIFGGESESGFVQSQTYLLNLDTLTWSKPSPPANLQRSPAARSAAIAGIDFAASNRHGFVVIGGKASDGTGLGDVWEYDFINQFWSQVTISGTGPSARWGAAGGIDFLTPPIQDPVVPGPNNTFYLAGGFDGTNVIPLSDVWRLNISGTLSSNLPDDSQGSWDHLTIDGLPPRFHQGGTVVSQSIIAAGGCNTTSDNISCAQQDAHIIDAQLQSALSPGFCPAPRYSPALAPNRNTFSSAFASQVFLLLGTFNETLWQDSNGLSQGEVAVLDINTGTWSRILPAGDPGTSGRPTFPSPRQGAAAISYPTSLVGQSRTSSSDTLVFGGQDANGTYLSELWLLRAYTGQITPSSPTWSGFGDGVLQTGVNANGAGVRISYISTCATFLASNSSGPSGSGSSPPGHGNPGSVGQFSSSELETSMLHQLFSPLSLAVLQPVVLIFRLSPRAFPRAIPHITWLYLAGVFGVAAYAIGVAGLTFAIKTLSKSPDDQDVTHMSTPHGQSGLALFACLYGAIPLLLLHNVYVNLSHQSDGSTVSGHRVSHSVEISDKQLLPPGAPGSEPQSLHTSSPPASPRPRTHSWGPSSMWQQSLENGLSTDTSESLNSTPPQRAFEVTNRPVRQRQRSESWRAVPLLQTSAQYNVASRSLGDIDWLQRRRSLNAVGELDYAISQAHRAQQAAEAEADMTTPARSPPPISPKKHKRNKIVITLLRLVVYWALLGLCIISLLMLWMRASPALFAVFLTWTVVLCITHLILAWRGYIPETTLFLIFSVFRSSPPPGMPDDELSQSQPLPTTATMTTTTTPSPGPQLVETHYNFPTSHGPYVNQPPHRTALFSARDDYSGSQTDPRSVDTDDDDNDDDDETRQMRMEEEMGRRDVSIVTVPKRKLWITNPS
ncbi:hypothetical protein BDN72DRAFT_809719 [Pluteus cervinus]|uniref:Uncharacterized protein n=1 Tax=Pluteus cervinus TaxID=181527 RepID=A0ACD3BC55_9AGAR|nr:hypothetical protein BDN72DRAFT_809719 [Pluteus cervinus]